MTRLYILNDYDITIENPPGAGAHHVVATLDKERLRHLVHDNFSAFGNEEWLDEATLYLRNLLDKDLLNDTGSIDLHDRDWDCRIQLHIVETV